jgi:hypothetical protein
LVLDLTDQHGKIIYYKTPTGMPSSVVAALHYYPERKVLRVIYVSGIAYDYKEVPESIYKAMKSSGSKGIYLNKYIKGKYTFEKVKNEGV